MKIEKGKFYRTRDGRKAEIYSTDNYESRFSVHGRILKSSAGPQGWTDSEAYLSSGPEHCLDLVAEWFDKPEIDCSNYSKSTSHIAMDENGD